MVLNPVSGRNFSKKWIFSNCCCACSLRIGSLVIGWLELIGNAILLLVILILYEAGDAIDLNMAALLSSHGLVGAAGLFMIIGGLKKRASLVWLSVYIHSFILIWNIIWIIIFSVLKLYGYLIWDLIQVILVFYVFILLRSYGYQLEIETTYQMEDESGIEVFEMDAEEGRSIPQTHVGGHTTTLQEESSSTSPNRKTTDQE